MGPRRTVGWRSRAIARLTPRVLHNEYPCILYTTYTTFYTYMYTILYSLTYTSLFNLLPQAQVPSKRVPQYTLARIMNNGANLSNTSDCNCVRDRPTCPLSRTSTSPTSSLGKRPASSETNMDKKKARHSTVVRDTVLTMMDNFFIEENEYLMEDNEAQQIAIDALHKDKAQLQRRIHLLEIQLEAAHRYSRMVEQWVPQVRLMFAGDLQDMLQIQAQQTADLEAETETEEE